MTLVEIEKSTVDELEEAIAALWAAFDSSVQMLMMTVDIFDVAQREGNLIDIPRYRQGLGTKIRELIAQRDAVLGPLGIDPDAEAEKEG